ncbi:MAG: type IV toxin-antitoxin system AbiEi family antitoxin [Bacteroidales bacterium]|nr:type IV toxin-antitoxin system AbiEi family antitoxin [Bacteroidales bacterium]
MEDNLIHTAINEILAEHNIKAFWKERLEKEVDGIIKLKYKGQTHNFYVEIKKEFREYHLPILFKLQKKYNQFMVIAEKKIFPKIKDALVERGIAYIDMYGNIYIEADNILIKVEERGEKYTQKEKHGRAFTKAGLKALLLFLTNENNINDTYRDIAKNAGIALGTVKLIFEGLIEEGFALRLNEKELKLTNKEQLLQKWIAAYNEKLKPALKVGNFRFNNPNDFPGWKKMNLNVNQTLWGGEPAGDIYTKFLQPEILTLYTNEKKADLIKNYRLIPDPEGNVLVYQKFWKEIDPEKNVVPPVIAYADLLATGKKRCIETAQKIYEQHIENTL